jgi:hypothetical protein
MFRNASRVIGAVVIALSVLVAALPSAAAAHGKHAASSKKKKPEKPSKRAGTKAERKSSARREKRGKNASSRDESRHDAREPVARTSRRAPDPMDDDDSTDEEPAGPRPANRLVADIAPGRVMEIQNALIKAGVFAGPASGVYDQSTFEAMSAFQIQNKLTATGMPTAEALKALGVRKNSGLAIAVPLTTLATTPAGPAAAPAAAQPATPPTAPPQPRPDVVANPAGPRPN